MILARSRYRHTVKPWLVALVAVAGIGTARVARGLAKEAAPGDELSEPPYAPTSASAPIVTLGYRELAADLLFVREVGYFGSPDNEAHAIASLAEAIAALDPQFQRPYEVSGIAITVAKRGVDNAARLRAIAVLEQAGREFPTSYKYPKLAAEIYLVDLKTDDPAQRRAWDEAGTRLYEAALRKPGASAVNAVSVAELRSRLGQQQRAIAGLEELLLVTTDDKSRERIIAKIAELSHSDADEIAAELLEARHRFESRWHAERYFLTPSLYLLIGPNVRPGFDLGDLATGGIPSMAPADIEKLEPLR